MSPQDPASDVALDQIGQISISVSNLDEAIRFYRDILGVPFLFQVPGSPPMAFFDCNGIRLYVVQSENIGTSTIYFKVDSARDAAKTLEERGVEMEGEPHIIHQTDSYTLWMAFFRDPDQNLMAVMSEEGDLMG